MVLGQMSSPVDIYVYIRNSKFHLTNDQLERNASVYTCGWDSRELFRSEFEFRVLTRS